MLGAELSHHRRRPDAAEDPPARAGARATWCSSAPAPGPPPDDRWAALAGTGLTMETAPGSTSVTSPPSPPTPSPSRCTRSTRHRPRCPPPAPGGDGDDRGQNWVLDELAADCANDGSTTSCSTRRAAVRAGGGSPVNLVVSVRSRSPSGWPGSRATFRAAGGPTREGRAPERWRRVPGRSAGGRPASPQGRPPSPVAQPGPGEVTIASRPTPGSAKPGASASGGGRPRR